MSRTPYSCGNYNNNVIQPHVTNNSNLIHDGYILVCQDVRGRWNSEGHWLEMTPAKDGKGIDESTDMSDTVDWLLKNIANNNARVGILGISYPGFYAAASIVDSNPAIKAASPQAPVMDLWMGDDSYHGGAFMLSANHSFYAPFFVPQKNPLTKEPKIDFDFPTQDMYAYYLHMGTLAHLDSPAGGTNPYFHDQIAHTTYDDYWQIRNLTPHMHGVKAAVLEVGGWFDAEDLAGPVKLFHSIDKLSPEAPENTLIEGPWVHGGWSRGTGASLGDIHFGDSPSTFYRDNIETPFFAHWLKNKPWTALPKAYTFETGSNVWKKYDAWPPPQAVTKTLYLQPDGGLAWSAPTASSSKDSYISDPAHPVPFVPYITGPDIPQRYMDDDQRFATTAATYSSTRPRRSPKTSPSSAPSSRASRSPPPAPTPTSSSNSSTSSPRITNPPTKRRKASTSPRPSPSSWRATRCSSAASPSARNSATPGNTPNRSRPAKSPTSTSPCRTSTTPFARATASWCRSRAHGSRSSIATHKPSWTSTKPSPKTSTSPPKPSSTRPTHPAASTSSSCLTKFLLVSRSHCPRL